MNAPSKAFILAAGLGTRLRPHTATRPKPLVEVNGRTLLDRTLDHLKAADVKEVMINTHYLAPQITGHLKSRTDLSLHFSHEENLLDTGGGIAKTIDFFEGAPFYVLSGDGLWSDKPGRNALLRLAQAWREEDMDILMLLQPLRGMILTAGAGDYDLSQDLRAVRSADKKGQYMFTSIRINHPRIFEKAPRGAFSYLKLMDEAERDRRLFGLEHQGEWHHISTPADLDAVDREYRDRKISA